MVAYLPSSIIVFDLFLHSTRLFSNKTFVRIHFTATSFDEFIMYDFDNIDDFDIVELALLQHILSTFLIGIQASIALTESLLAVHVKEQRRLNRALPSHFVRPTWESFSSRLNDNYFRKLFRMPRISFNHLCTKLEHAAGSRAFKAESKILSSGEDFDMLRNVPANVGGILPGELKVAIMLRLLAGACYLCLLRIFSYNSLQTF
jgi:hypothetical protein